MVFEIEDIFRFVDDDADGDNNAIVLKRHSAKC